VDIISRLHRKNETDPLPLHTKYISNLLSGRDLNRFGKNVVAKPRLAFGFIHYNAVEEGHFTVELAGRVAPSNREVRIYLGYDFGEPRLNTELSPNYGGHNKVYYGSNLIVGGPSPAVSIKLYGESDWRVENQLGPNTTSELVIEHYHATDGFPKWPPLLTTSNNIPLFHDLDIKDKTELLILGPPFDYRKGESTYNQRRIFIAYSPKTSVSEYQDIVRELPKGVRSSDWIDLAFDSTIIGEDSYIEIS